jgi:dTMP kinase
MAMALQKKGLLISFEGIDGSGKTSQIEGVAKALENLGRTVCKTREPGGCLLAEKLRHLVLEESIDSLTETLLMFAGRREHILQTIAPALKRGEIVLCDRFSDATFAYQGGGRYVNIEYIATLQSWVQQISGGQNITPDLTLWFDVPAKLAMKRLVNVRTPDRFESESTAFFERVIAAYNQQLQKAPERFIRIDGNQSLQKVQESVYMVLCSKGYLI